MNDLQKVIYFDDELEKDNGAKLIAQRLNRQGKIHVTTKQPPRFDELDFKSEDCDLFLVDYDLSSSTEDNNFSYKGTTLASEIRERYPQHPIVIVTQGVNSNIQERLETVNPIFDELILKSEINAAEKINYITSDLADLASGYSYLRERDSKGQVLTLANMEDILKWPATANMDLVTDLREMGIPKIFNVEPIARWIRHTFLAYPGFVMSDNHAAAYLGIDLDTFKLSWVQEILRPASYQGLFHTSKPRWWRSSLIEIAINTIRRYEIDKTFFTGFVEALEKEAKTQGHEKEQIWPSRCIWDNSPSATALCYVLKKPVQISNSFRYYPDTRPAIMEPARVSFRAIRENENVEEEMIEFTSNEILDDIKYGYDPIAGDNI